MKIGKSWKKTESISWNVPRKALFVQNDGDFGKPKEFPIFWKSGGTHGPAHNSSHTVFSPRFFRTRTLSYPLLYCLLKHPGALLYPYPEPQLTRNCRVALPLLSRNCSGSDFRRHRCAASAQPIHAPAASLSVRTFLHERSHWHLSCGLNVRLFRMSGTAGLSHPGEDAGFRMWAESCRSGIYASGFLHGTRIDECLSMRLHI